MAYPSNILFRITTPQGGLQGIHELSSTAQHPIGHEVLAVDENYNAATFIYLAGVASTAAGDWVAYNTDSGATTRTLAASRGNLAVAMAACVAGYYGWYMRRGSAVVSTTAAGTGAANAFLCVTGTAGRATVAGTDGQRINGAICTGAQDAPGAGYTVVQLSDPFCQGDTFSLGQAAEADLTDNSGGVAADGTIGVVTAPTALTDNGGGVADGTVASQAAPVTLTDSSGYSGTHDDTIAATPAIVTLTDNTGGSGTHDDTLATGDNAAAPIALTAIDLDNEIVASADAQQDVVALSVAVGTLGGAADGSFETVGDTSTGDRSGQIMNNFQEIRAKLDLAQANDATIAVQVDALVADIISLRGTVADCVTDLGVQNQTDSDLAQKIIELVTREAVTAQHVSNVAQKVIELVTLAGTAQNNLRELTTAQSQDRTAIVALTDAVTELSTKINDVLAKLRLAGILNP